MHIYSFVCEEENVKRINNLGSNAGISVAMKKKDNNYKAI